MLCHELDGVFLLKQDVDVKTYFELPESPHPFITIIAPIPITNERLVLKKHSLVFLEIKSYFPSDDNKEIETETQKKKKNVSLSSKEDCNFETYPKKKTSNVSNKVSQGKKVLFI